MATVPSPTLDARNGDLVTAQAISSLPDELSDRSDGSPQVVLLEANGALYDALIYQLNNWPRAVLQKVAALVNMQLLDATAATTTLQFTLSAPQANDTIVAAGTEVGTEDGDVSFATTADLTILGYSIPAGTISMTAGSTAVTGSGTTFVTGSAWVGYQIRAVNGTWYTIASVSTTTSLTLTENAASTVSGQAWNVGPIVGSAPAQATSTGATTNVGSDTLTSLQSSPPGVGSVTNTAEATGGGDQETAAEATERAPDAFAIRDVACTTDDYAEFARKQLGDLGRARAKANVNLTTATAGYVTLALLSPDWTTSSAVSATERAAVVRDLQGRSFFGSTLIDTPVSFLSLTSAGATPACLVVKSSRFSSAAVTAAVAAKLNTYLSPDNYPWDLVAYPNGRPIYVSDLAERAEAADGVDRVYEINGRLACGTDFRTAANAIDFTNGSTGATCNAADSANMVAGQTFLYSAADGRAYLVTAIPTSTTLTLDRVFEGVTASPTAVPFFTSDDRALANWYTLPYANLTSTAPSILVVTP